MKKMKDKRFQLIIALVGMIGIVCFSLADRIDSNYFYALACLTFVGLGYLLYIGNQPINEVSSIIEADDFEPEHVLLLNKYVKIQSIWKSTLKQYKAVPIDYANKQEIVSNDDTYINHKFDPISFMHHYEVCTNVGTKSESWSYFIATLETDPAEYFTKRMLNLIKITG